MDAFRRLRGLGSTALLGILVACGGGSGSTGSDPQEHEGASALSRAAVAAAAGTEIPPGRYLIANASSKLCVDAVPASADGGVLRQAACAVSTNQAIDITQPSAGVYRMVVVGTGRVIDLSGSSAADGATFWQWTDNGTNAQRFKLQRTQGNRYALVNAGSGKCVAIDGGSLAEGAGLRQAGCDANQAAQQFLFYPVTAAGGRAAIAVGQYNLQSVSSRLCVEIADASLADGGKTQQTACADSPQQRFEVKPAADDSYSFINVNSGKGLDVSGISIANGALIQQWTYGGAANQRFSATLDGAGLHLQPKHDGKCLDVKDFSTVAGGQVQQWDCGGNDNQRWLLQASAVQPPAHGSVTPDQVLLVINANSATSAAIGADYQQRRGVSNVVQVRTLDSALGSGSETLSGSDYKSQIEQPIRNFLAQHPQVNFIVLTKGVPIRVNGAATGDTFNAGGAQASVDGQLAALDYDRLPGAKLVSFNAPSGFASGSAWLNRYWNADEPFSHAKFGGYIVTRLDAFTQAQALGLTAKALQAEAATGQNPGQGTILLDIQPDFGINDPATQPAPITDSVITRESDYGTWNGDLQHAGQDLAARGIPVLLDTRNTFVGNQTSLLGYYSWGSNDSHYSATAYHSLRFLPGAIGDTAVSTSAESMLPPGSGGQSAIGDLLAQGITGVKGYVNEPLLQAISSPYITFNRYTRGYTLGESFAAGSHFVGWTDLVIGDPLAHPYPSR
ncbi:TIGR03790 family protein [Rhizobacter sp. P5_C2]